MKYINYTLVAALVLASLLAVRETVMIVAGPPDLKAGAGDAKDQQGSQEENEPRIKPLSHYAPAIANNVFGIEGQSLSTITGEQLQQEETAPVQAAPSVTFKLMGTVAWSDAKGYAFVTESGSEQKLYKNQQTIPGAGVLMEVYPESVVMDFNGNVYEVFLEKFNDTEGQGAAAGARQKPDRNDGTRRAAVGGKDFSQFARRTGDNEFVVSKRAIDESIQNPQNVLTDARLLPNMDKGAQVGFRISEIKRGGLYENLGLLNGDILLAVNDFQLSSPESALQAFTTLQGSSFIKLNIQRRGKKIELKYNIR